MDCNDDLVAITVKTQTTTQQENQEKVSVLYGFRFIYFRFTTCCKTVVATCLLAEFSPSKKIYCGVHTVEIAF